MLQDVAGDSDRVALVTNVDAERRPADRSVQLAPDALAFLTRMGASHLTGPTLFDLWKLSLQDVDRARAQVERHAEAARASSCPRRHCDEGGLFYNPRHMTTTRTTRRTGLGRSARGARRLRWEERP